MRVRSFLVLCLVTVVAVAAAIALAARQETPVSVAGAGERLLPQLLNEANRIDQIRIVSGDKTVTLDRAEGTAAAESGGWIIVDRDGYPASFEKIKALVVGLAQLKRVDPKTGRPDRYAQIGVEDPGPGAQSTEVTLSDAAGQPIARVILGKESFAGGGDGRYARIPGEANAWQVAGPIEAEADVRAWAAPQVIDIPGSEIQSVRVRRPEGGTMTAIRPAPGTREFVLQDVPAGRRQSHGGTDTLGDILSNVELEDVLPIARVAFPRPETTRVRVETFDGLVLEVDLVQRDGATWMRLTPETTDRASAEVKARAAEIARRTSGWAYQVPEWRFGPLKKPLDDWLEPDKPS